MLMQYILLLYSDVKRILCSFLMNTILVSLVERDPASPDPHLQATASHLQPARS